MRLLFCLLGIVIISCNKKLDKIPLNAPSTESFPRSLSDFKTALVGCNSPLQLVVSSISFTSMFEMYSDIGVHRDNTPDVMMGDPGSSFVRTIWTTMYKGIGRCNYLLDNIDKANSDVDAAALKNIESSAKFLRAYYYSLLVELFGDVPYITTTLSLSEANVSRMSKDHVVDSILNDLDKASQFLTEQNNPASMDISKGAAWALMSRVALYNKRWDVAIAAANKVMALEGSQYILEPDYTVLTKLAGNSSKELIWAIHWSYTNATNQGPTYFRSRNAGGFTNRMPTQSLVDSYQCIDGLPVDQSPLYNPLKPYDNRDPRLNWSVAVPGSIFCGYQYETHKDSVTCWNYNVTPAVRIPNEDAINAFASFSGFSWRKYVDSTEFDEGAKTAISSVVMRYAEVLHNYAEAKIESNQIDQSVYDAINKVRARANMPLIESGKTQSELRAILRYERKVEFAGEGTRYFDILRWGIAEEVLNGPCYGRIPNGILAAAPVIDENSTPHYQNISNYDKMRVIQVRRFNKASNYLWPIPDIEMQVNENLVQNPGY